MFEANNHQEIIKDLKKIVKIDFTTGLKGKSLKINLTDITDFRNLTKFYENSQLKFHTFQDPSEKKLEVVIRNVSLSLSEDEIKQELLDLSYPVSKVVRLMNKDKYFLPLCAVDLENNEDSHDIFKLNALCHAVVTVGPKRKSREIPQCLKCQRFGHTRNFCHLDPRCVRCTGLHMYSECPLSKDVSPVCVNCGENHSANFRGCKHYQDLKLKLQKTHAKNQKSNLINSTSNDATDVVIPSNSETPNNSNNRQAGTTLKKGSFAGVTKQREAKPATHTATSSYQSKEHVSLDETSGKDGSMLIDFETLIMDLVKSVIPMLKQFLSKAIMSIFNNGSI